MQDRFYFDELHETETVSSVMKSRPVRYALAFSGLMLAATFLVAPRVTDPDSGMRQFALEAAALGVDPVTTGTVQRGNTGEYIMRRSVLSRSAGDVCIIRSDGTFSGAC